MPVEPLYEAIEEPEDDANRARLLGIVAFVTVVAIASLAVYLWMRPPNRHSEPTPYDQIISQLRTSMSEDDVMALFRTSNENGARGEYSATAEGAQRVLVYRLQDDEPLRVKLGGPRGQTVAEWCYRDHCYDNIE